MDSKNQSVEQVPLRDADGVLRWVENESGDFGVLQERIGGGNWKDVPTVTEGCDEFAVIEPPYNPFVWADSVDLKPIGVDVDGVNRTLNELSYEPAGGWEDKSC